MWPIILIILAVIYLLNPYDLLPDLLIGWGWLDDLVIIGLLLHFLAKRHKNRVAGQARTERGETNDSGREEYTGNKRHRDPNHAADRAPDDPYEILGVDKDASQETIKQAYRELAAKYHPDKVEYLGNEFKALAEKRFKAIQSAYEKLKRD